VEILPVDEERRASPVSALMSSACAGIFVFGIVMAILGAILPSLFERIHFGKGEAGNLFFVMNLAMLVMSVIFGPVVDRFGYRSFLIACSLLVAVSFFVFSRAAAFSWLVAGALVLGFGGGGLNGGANALASDLYPERRSAALNLIGIFFGFGALSMPFLVGLLLDRLGLKSILSIAALLSLVPMGLFLALRFPRAKQARGFPLGQAARVIRDPLLWLCGILLFFESGNEFTAGGWLAAFLNETFRFPATSAALVLAGYWAGMMAGRLLVSFRLVRVMKNEILILVSAIFSLGAALLIILAPSAAAAALGIILLGLGLAAIYPTTLAVVGGAFPTLSGTAFSVIFTVALVGGMTAPWLVGKIAAASTIRRGLVIPAVNCAAIIGLQLAVIRLERARRAASRRVSPGGSQ
jgi:FHS family glucose/mannose:H+ symporter-like MFS transporter